MGWYADVEYTLTFRSRDDLARAGAHLRATANVVDALREKNERITYGSITEIIGWPNITDDEQLLSQALTQFSEEGDGVVEHGADGSIIFSGWGSGKGYPAPIKEPNFEVSAHADGTTHRYFNNGMGLGRALGYAHGVMDWIGESHERWRWRFHGDGTYAEYEGQVHYVGDPGDPGDRASATANTSAPTASTEGK